MNLRMVEDTTHIKQALIHCQTVCSPAFNAREQILTNCEDEVRTYNLQLQQVLAPNWLHREFSTYVRLDTNTVI